MSDIKPQVVRSYLAGLDRELRGLPEGLAREIRDGVEEQLSGLDAAGAAASIEHLGDPSFIAAEARAGIEPAERGSVSPVAASAGVISSRGFAITAALFVALGGVVVPLIGWIVGVAMVWMSPLWRRVEKLATLIGPIAIALLVTLSLLLQNVSAPDAESHNPLIVVPGWSFLALLPLLAAINVIVGIWLLWRAKGRAI